MIKNNTFTKKFNKILTDKNHLKNNYFDYSKFSNQICLMEILTQYYKLDYTNFVVQNQLSILDQLSKLLPNRFSHKKLSQIQENKIVKLNKDLCDNFILFYCMIKERAKMLFINHQDFINNTQYQRTQNGWYYANYLNNNQRKFALGKENYNRFKDLVNSSQLLCSCFKNVFYPITIDLIYLDKILIATNLFLKRLLNNANIDCFNKLMKYKVNIDTQINLILFNKN